MQSQILAIKNSQNYKYTGLKHTRINNFCYCDKSRFYYYKYSLIIPFNYHNYSLVSVNHILSTCVKTFESCFSAYLGFVSRYYSNHRALSKDIIYIQKEKSEISTPD